jgi:signal transduction histidine kinase
VQNAVDAAGPTGRVRLALTRDTSLSGETGWATIMVTDNGPGMDRDFIDQKLFQPMSSTKTTGFGVGAYQVRQHVREMGGQLEVDSTPGRGTRMTVRLPLVLTGAADATPTPNRERNLRVIYG